MAVSSFSSFFPFFELFFGAMAGEDRAEGWPLVSLSPLPTTAVDSAALGRTYVPCIRDSRIWLAMASSDENSRVQRGHLYLLVAVSQPEPGTEESTAAGVWAAEPSNMGLHESTMWSAVFDGSENNSGQNGHMYVFVVVVPLPSGDADDADVATVAGRLAAAPMDTCLGESVMC